MSALLEIRGASKLYRSGLLAGSTTVALDDVTLALDEDKPTITAVVGESGSGKTTLGSLMLGFIDPSMGTALYRGRPIHTLSRGERDRFRREVQAIFQDPFAAYNPFYTVDHVLMVPIQKFGLARSKAESRALMEEALTTVGLRPEETLGRYPHQLSGGQRQRIIVARAMLLKPKVIIADEPVSMVDASLRATILESIFKLHQDLGISVLYITHDLTTAYHIGSQIVVMYRGSVMEAGETEAVVTNPQHPYTRLLIDSVPWPDPDRKWGQTDIGSNGKALRSSAASGQGCKFAPRCPLVMERCFTAAPPLYQTDGAAVLAGPALATADVAPAAAPVNVPAAVASVAGAAPDGLAVATGAVATATAAPSLNGKATEPADRARAVACYLWDEFPAVEREKLPDLLRAI